MPINFPNNPQTNDTYTEGNRSWTFNGVYWKATSATIGYTGSQGDTGFVGSQGYTGSRGDDGTSVRIIDAVASSAQLPTPYNGAIGDGYITQDTGSLWVWDGTQWNNVGQIIGYTGSLGYTGSQGAGFTGSQGDTGYTGSEGQAGFTGSRGSLETWTRTTVNYTASNNQRIIADTSGGQFVVTLPPNPTTGFYVVLTDGADWSLNPVLVDGNGNTIEGYSDQISLDIQGVTVEFIWNLNDWEVTATLGVQGDPGYTGSQGLPGEAAAIGYTGSQADLTSVTQNIIPDTNNVYDLGSDEKRWRHIYVSGQTIYLGTTTLQVDPISAKLTVTDLGGNPVPVGSVEISTTEPLSPMAGNLWYNPSTEEFLIYVNDTWASVGGGASVETSATAPADPADGDMWFDSNLGVLSVYYSTGWISTAGGEIDFANLATNIATSGTVKTTSPFFLNTKTINSNYTVAASDNAMSAGPIEIANGVTVTINDGGEWTIV